MHIFHEICSSIKLTFQIKYFEKKLKFKILSLIAFYRTQTQFHKIFLYWVQKRPLVNYSGFIKLLLTKCIKNKKRCFLRVLLTLRIKFENFWHDIKTSGEHLLNHCKKTFLQNSLTYLARYLFRYSFKHGKLCD